MGCEEDYVDERHVRWAEEVLISPSVGWKVLGKRAKFSIDGFNATSYLCNYARDSQVIRLHEFREATDDIGEHCEGRGGWIHDRVKNVRYGFIKKGKKFCEDL